jgi:hypothetical protein
MHGTGINHCLLRRRGFDRRTFGATAGRRGYVIATAGTTGGWSCALRRRGMFHVAPYNFAHLDLADMLESLSLWQKP